MTGSALSATFRITCDLQPRPSLRLTSKLPLAVAIPSLDLYAAGHIKVDRSGFIYNFATGRFGQTVKLTNISQNSFSGPISLVLDGLPGSVSLFNPAGVTAVQLPAGSPYVNTGGLTPSQSVTLTLQFNDSTKTAITYTPRVLAGSAPR